MTLFNEGEKHIQLTPNNSNLQGKSEKLRVIERSSYCRQNYKETDLKGKSMHFDLVGGSSY